jgi:chromosome segregation ATPase
MSGLSEKAKTFPEIQNEIIKARCQWTDLSLEKHLQKQKWVLVSVAQQEIDNCETSWQNLKDTIPKFETKISYLEDQLKSDKNLIEEMRRERGLQKQKLQQKAIRLLQIRAGGRYRMFEAGMLYQCLVLLGMPEYTKHKQVDALVKVTCHYFHESDAKKQFEDLLK